MCIKQSVVYFLINNKINNIKKKFKKKKKIQCHFKNNKQQLRNLQT